MKAAASKAPVTRYVQVLGRKRNKGEAHPVHTINPGTGRTYCQFENNYMATSRPQEFKNLKKAYRWADDDPKMCVNCERDKIVSAASLLRPLSSLPSTAGFEFVGVRHNGSKIDLVLRGDEPMFVAGTEVTDICENWVLFGELAGWLDRAPLRPEVASAQGGV